MKVLLVGRDGQLGRSLVERAQGRELELIAVGRKEADLAVPGTFAKAIRAAGPDLVINAAAYTAVDKAEDEPELAFRINAEAAGEAAHAAREACAAFVQISTDYVFDGQSDEPYDVDAPANPINVYGRSKLAGEEAVRAANADHVIIRTAWLYSPFGRNFVRTMVEAANRHDCLRIVDDQRGSPTSAFDVADGLLSMLERWRSGKRIGASETYHLAGAGTASWFELAGHVMDCCRAVGLPVAQVEPIATEDWPTKATRPRNSALDSGKFARDFGFAMPGWRFSVAEAVQRLASGQA